MSDCSVMAGFVSCPSINFPESNLNFVLSPDENVSRDFLTFVESSYGGGEKTCFERNPELNDHNELPSNTLPVFSFSQSSDVVDAFSQIMHDNPSSLEEENTEEFQLYALSDPEDNDTNPLTETEELTELEDTERIETTNVVFYSVPKTEEELMSAFCKTEFASDDNEDEEDSLFSFIYDQQKNSKLEISLAEAAASRDLSVSFKMSFRGNMFIAKATAGQVVYY